MQNASKLAGLAPAILRKRFFSERVQLASSGIGFYLCIPRGSVELREPAAARGNLFGGDARVSALPQDVVKTSHPRAWRQKQFLAAMSAGWIAPC